jgi:hypothetical protein
METPLDNTLHLVIARLPGKEPFCATEEFLLGLDLHFPDEETPRKPVDINEAIGALGGSGLRHTVTLRDPASMTALDDTEVEGRLWAIDPQTRLPIRHPEWWTASTLLQYITEWRLTNREGKDVPKTMEGFLSLERSISDLLAALILPRYDREVSWNEYFRKP